MSRRFVLVGLMVLAQGSMLQLIMGTLLSAIFLLFQVQVYAQASRLVHTMWLRAVRPVGSARRR